MLLASFVKLPVGWVGWEVPYFTRNICALIAVRDLVTRKATVMTYLLSYMHGSFPTHLAPSEKGSALKGKNLLPWGANSFLLEYAPFQKGSKNSLTDLPHWKVCQFLIITPQEFKHLQPTLLVHNISGVVTLSDFRVIMKIRNI